MTEAKTKIKYKLKGINTKTKKSNGTHTSYYMETMRRKK